MGTGMFPQPDILKIPIGIILCHINVHILFSFHYYTVFLYFFNLWHHLWADFFCFLFKIHCQMPSCRQGNAAEPPKCPFSAYIRAALPSHLSGYSPYFFIMFRMISTHVSMDCTQANSNRPWKFCPPVPRFGHGRPI